MKDIEQLTEEYIIANEIRFELRAVNGDDEVVLKYTSEHSASHLDDDMRKLDGYIQTLVLEEQQDKADLAAEAEVQEQIDRQGE